MKINVVMVTLDAMNKPVRKNGTVTVMLGATPQPPVIPPSTKVTYAFVVESAVPDSSTAIWLEDAATWTPLGLTMHKIYHPGDALPAGLGERAAQAGGYPALVLCGAADATGALKFIDAVPLPKSAADTQAKIRTYGSK
jgi:hypothetical protein